MKTTHNLSYTILIIVFTLLFSCKKLVEVEAPIDRIERNRVFSNDATAVSAASGLYIQMIRTNLQFASAATTLYTALSADEMYNRSPSPFLDEFRNNNITPGNGNIRSGLWLPAYNIIFQANNIIEGLASSANVSPAIKEQIEGEAKFIRAFCHFYLVNMFGEVPLVITTDYTKNATLQRASKTELYQQIVQDLTEAKLLLKQNYPSTARVRPNRSTASALLARVYLYMGEWMKAETEASAVINAGLYTMVSNTGNVFLINSNETIWQLMPTSTTANTWEGNIFIPAAGTAPAYPMTASLANAFSVTDNRKTNWTKTVTVAGVTYVHPFKYKVKTATTLSEYYVVLRLAEQYLIRAEARARLNNSDAAKADLNIVRNRAGLANTTANDVASLLLTIENERRLELFAEWGHRWFDLKRTGRANAVLGLVKPSWQPTDTLYPIPALEILRNSSLTQNPGY